VKKVLVLGPVPPPYGGIATVMFSIIESELRSEFEFDVFNRTVLPDDRKSFIQRMWFRIQRFYAYFKKLRTGKYDFVHIHSADPVFPGTVIFMIITRLAGTKILLHMHGTDWDDFYSRASKKDQLIVRYGIRLADHVIVLYSLWETNLRNLYPGITISTVHNLIHRMDEPNTNTVRQKKIDAGISPTQFTVVSIGTVGYRKGSFEILKAVPGVIAKEPSIRFLLVGGEEVPGEYDQVASVMKDSNLSEFVKMTGEVVRDDVPYFLAMADIFILPSYIEGMPMSIIEAMQLGKPIIASKVGGIPEMIEDGVSGLLIDPGDPNGIAHAVLTLFSSPELRNKLGSKAAEAFAEKFEFSTGIKQIRSVYSSM
jgi:glycosyltransferase involved in cell wall biosynthesis